MVTSGLSQGPRPASGSDAGTNAEHDRSRKRYKGKDCRRPGYDRGGQAGNDRSNRRVDGVHKPKPATDEIAGQNEADETGSNCDKDL